VITSRFVRIYGHISVVVLLVLLVLVWFQLVDPSFNLPILIFAFIIIFSRVLLRFIARRNEIRQGGDTEK
jgi:hypothetical protein